MYSLPFLVDDGTINESAAYSTLRGLIIIATQSSNTPQMVRGDNMPLPMRNQRECSVHACMRATEGEEGYSIGDGRPGSLFIDRYQHECGRPAPERPYERLRNLQS
jgi:hypothetical protein